MRLVFVHGINQQNKNPEKLKDVWISDLENGLGRPGALKGVTVEMPYYGNVLYKYARKKSRGAIAQGLNDQEDRDLANFMAEAMGEFAKAQGITNQEIAKEQQVMPAGTQDAVDMGFPMNRRINAIFRLIERKSKTMGDLGLRLVDQAYAYLRKPGVGTAVDNIVAPKIQSGGPMVLVAHSLGSVVTFKLLRQFAGQENSVPVALYVTLGSPLPLEAVQRALGPTFANPAGIRKWVNARDRDDVVTLNAGLKWKPFRGPIKNLKGVRNVKSNGATDAHAIPGYLAYPPVARAIAAALGL